MNLEIYQKLCMETKSLRTQKGLKQMQERGVKMI